MRNYFLVSAFLLGLSAGDPASLFCLSAATIAQHSGATNPTAQGFAAASATGTALPGDSDGTLTFDAFQVVGPDLSGYYLRTPNPQELNDARNDGWKMTVNARLPNGGGFAYATFFDSVQRWDIFLSSDGEGDKLLLWDGTDGLNGGPSYRLGDRAQYHFMELIFSSSTNKANLYVNGVLAIENFTGGQASTAGLALFGSTNSVPVNFNLYKLETGEFTGSAYPSPAGGEVPEPGGLALMAGGLICLYWRSRT